MKRNLFLRFSSLSILLLGLMIGLLSSCRAKYTHKVSKYGVEKSYFRKMPENKI